MESLLTSFMSQSLTHSLIIVAMISFLESLTLVGLLLPGIVLMTALGTLIGNEKLSFYPAWIAGFIGCLLGDWISYYIGWKFKDWLHNLYLFKRYESLLKKTKEALYSHSAITILIGRFIGPTRPLIPMVSGMLKLPFKKFMIPNLIACLLWPPIYFLPGIFTGVIINTPQYSQNNNFKLLLFLITSTIWLGVWLLWKWKKSDPNENVLLFLSKKIIGYLAILFLLIGIIGLVSIQFHPQMSLLKHLLFKVFKIT